MRPGDVRRQVLSQHRELREMLAPLEELAWQVRREERHLLGPLRAQGDALLRRLREHMEWEDEHLRAALVTAAPDGEARAEELAHDHVYQREMLQARLRDLWDQAAPAVSIARGVLDLVSEIRDDMIEEEELIDEGIVPVAGVALGAGAR